MYGGGWKIGRERERKVCVGNVEGKSGREVEGKRGGGKESVLNRLQRAGGGGGGGG